MWQSDQGVDDFEQRVGHGEGIEGDRQRGFHLNGQLRRMAVKKSIRSVGVDGFGRPKARGDGSPQAAHAENAERVERASSRNDSDRPVVTMAGASPNRCSAEARSSGTVAKLNQYPNREPAGQP